MTFHVDENIVPDNLQTKLIELKYNNEMKHFFVYINIVIVFGSTYICATFFEDKIYEDVQCLLKVRPAVTYYYKKVIR